MTNKLRVSTLAIIAVCGVTTLVSAANREKTAHVPTETMLEFSLNHLKESFDETSERNEQLSYENSMLFEDIRHLEFQRRRLLAQKAELSGDSDTSGSYFDQVVGMEEVAIDRRLSRTQELIIIFRQKIAELREKLIILEASVDQKKFESRKRSLLEREQEGAKRLSQLEKELNALEGEQAAPLRKIQTLTDEKTALEGRINILSRMPKVF